MRNTADKYLILFDIDGTLIRSYGRGKEAMLEALLQRYGLTLAASFHDFAGSTDRRIIRTLIRRSGQAFPDEDKVIDAVLTEYLDFLEPLLQEEGAVKIMPGIPELVEHMHRDERFVLGLLTGNIEPGARMKLAPADLNKYFEFGAFGNDAEDRNDLPPIAHRRGVQYSGVEFSPRQCWIIGDTPRDIECALKNDMRCIAVATSGFSIEDLSSHNPDATLADLSATHEVLRIITEQ